MLELRGVAKRFGDQEVIASASLTLRAGEVVCLTGPSGVGKSTLLEIAAGVTRPDAGCVIRAVPAALMFQDDVLIPWLNAERTVTYILPDTMTAGQKAERAKMWLDRFDLDPGLLPSAMSGGMRRRLAIARTFAAGRSLILLDEPYAFLDEARCRVVSQTIAEHAGRGCGVLLTSHTTAPLHHPPLAELCPRTIPVASQPVVIG